MNLNRESDMKENNVVMSYEMYEDFKEICRNE